MKLVALTAIAFAGAAVGMNCSKSSNPNSGDVKLAVVLPSGDTISNVSYTILNSGGGTITSGTFSVTDPNATVSLDIVVPVTAAGDAGDKVQLSATATGPGGVTEACSGTSPSFPVVAGNNTPVTMTLTCGTGSQSTQTGNVGITASLVEGDHCPNITSVVVGPDETSVGGSASVVAVATDSDSGETVSYAWAPAANFVNPAVGSTSYKCTASGTQTFTVTVSDTHNPPCTTQATLTIKCDNVATCGDGTVEPGEDCEPPNTATCDSTCHTIAPSTGGTTGTAGAPATGGTTGTAGAPATGGTTGAAGAGGAPATGGTTGAAGSGVFAQDNAACVSCENAGTSAGTCSNTTALGALAASGAGLGCDGFASATDKQNCLNLVACLRGATCQALIQNATPDYYESAQGFIDPLPCLCNTPTTAIGSNACQALSTWSGTCASLYMTATPSNLLGEFYGSATPAGIATNLMACDVATPCTSAATCKLPQ